MIAGSYLLCGRLPSIYKYLTKDQLPRASYTDDPRLAWRVLAVDITARPRLTDAIGSFEENADAVLALAGCRCSVPFRI